MIRNKATPVKVSIKVAESDKERMVENFHMSLAKAKEAAQRQRFQPYSEPKESEFETDLANAPSTALPEFSHLTPDKEGWITIDKPLLYVYAGQGPYAAPELMQFPVSLPDDGYIDIVVQAVVSIYLQRL